ncbi:MAG TPA: hypothetical protein ENK52_00970 [Saprospiraceae bacterium]|nr:hypothetical protein [Saprospiraceae bacterium]
MKLHKCHYCKIDVSPRAKLCPNCGEPNPTRGGVEGFRLVIKLLFILLILGMLFMYIFDGIILNVKPSIYLFSLLIGVFMFRQLAKE